MILLVLILLTVPVAAPEKRSSLMDILDEAGRQCRAMGPGACQTFVAHPAKPKAAR